MPRQTTRDTLSDLPTEPPLDLTRARVETLMVPEPQTCTPEMTVQKAAQIMRDWHISCLCVVEGNALVGIVTLRDLSGKALAGGLAHDTPIRAVMTENPRALPPSAIGSDVLHLMAEHRLGHLPVVSGGRLVGFARPRAGQRRSDVLPLLPCR